MACLMYHNVFNEKTEGIISEEEFEKHMEYIKDMSTSAKGEKIVFLILK